MGTLLGSDCFQLKQDETIHHQVSAKLADILIAKPDRNLNLALHLHSGLNQSDPHAVAVDGLQEAWSNLVVDIVINANDLFCKRSMYELSHFLVFPIRVHPRKSAVSSYSPASGPRFARKNPASSISAGVVI